MKRFWIKGALAILYLFLSLLFTKSLGAEEVKSLSGLEWYLYGRTKMNISYDTAQLVGIDNFVGTVVNSKKNAAWGNDNLFFSPQDTRLGAKIIHKQEDWYIRGRLEVDFLAGDFENISPRLRLSYMSISNLFTKSNLLIGQAWTPIARINPSTLDPGRLTEAGNLWGYWPQITLRQRFNSHWIFSLSLMKPFYSDPGREDRMPWLLSRIEYSLGPNIIAVGGGYRNAYYGTNNSNNVDRFLLVGEWKLVLLDDTFIFKGEIWKGKGIGECFHRSYLDTDPTGVTPLEAFGLWMDFTYKFDPRWSVTVGFGLDDPDEKYLPSLNLMSDYQFTKNTQFFANVCYKITKWVKVGVEVLRIVTERYDEQDAGQRYTISFKYIF